MYSREYADFEDAFARVFDVDKAAWVKANRAQLASVAAVEEQPVFDVLLCAIYKGLKYENPNRKEIAAAIFKDNLDLIKYKHLVNVWNYFTNDTAKEIINAWDQQTKEVYDSTETIQHVASYIKDTDLAEFCKRHQRTLKKLARKEERERVYSPIIDILYDRRNELTPDIGRDLFMPYINVINDDKDFSLIRNALASKRAAAGLSAVCLAWKQRRDKKDAAPLSFEDVEYFFEHSLQDEDRIPFLKTCLPQLDAYMQETEKTALKTIMQLFTHLKTEQLAWALARECFPYVKTQDDLDDLTTAWRYVVANERTEKQSYQKEAMDQSQIEFVAAFNQYKVDAAQKVSENENTMFGKMKKVESLEKHRQHKHRQHKHKKDDEDDEKQHHRHHRKSHH